MTAAENRPAKSTSFSDDSPPGDLDRRRILLGITGASGALYGEMYLQFLLKATACRIYVVATEVACQVINYELSSSDDLGSLKRIIGGALSRKTWLEEEKDRVQVFSGSDYFAPVASGTGAAHAMVILPCSMGTVARIAAGMSSSLLERAGDVMLKQNRPLIIAPRESPVSTLHLQNLLALSQLGAAIVPLMPALYQKPKTVEDMVRFSVGRVCELLGQDHAFYAPWSHRRM